MRNAFFFIFGCFAELTEETFCVGTVFWLTEEAFAKQ